MRELSQGAMEALFPKAEPSRVSTGLITNDGIAVNGEIYKGSPSIARGGSSKGGSAITMYVGRIPVVIGYGGFHTP